jgi:hypothetical protein
MTLEDHQVYLRASLDLTVRAWCTAVQLRCGYDMCTPHAVVVLLPGLFHLIGSMESILHHRRVLLCLALLNAGLLPYGDQQGPRRPDGACRS